MASFATETVRDIVLCGHGSTGKTSLIDRLLEITHAVDGTHSVDDGTSVCDFEPEEKAHHLSIEATLAHFQHQGLRFNVIDAPGYPDFIGHTISAMRGADTAMIVIDAHAGIAVNTRRVFQEAEKAGIGRMIVVNKIDTEHLDFATLMQSIRDTFGQACVPINFPRLESGAIVGVVDIFDEKADTSNAPIDPAIYKESLVEAAIEADEVWMERYFEGEVPTNEDLKTLIPKAVANGTLIPIVCCSIKKAVGISELLDAMALCSLPPSMVHRKAKSGDGSEIELLGDPNGPLAAQVFQTRIDPFVQKLSYIRVYNGTLRKDMTLPGSNGRKGLRIGQLLDVQANHLEPIDQAGPGDIVAVAKMEQLHTGTNEGELELPIIEFPQPMVGVAIRPKSRNDEAKLSMALHKLVEEDPTIQIEHDQETHELVLRGMSELHLALIQEKLARRDHLEIETYEPRIPFRESITYPAHGSYRHKKQSGGRGQFGEVHIRIQPLPQGTDIATFATKDNFPSMKHAHYFEAMNFLWVDSIVGASIPGNFMPAVEKGLLDRVHKGVLAGYPLQDLCVEVHYGKHHPVDSSETAFRIAASAALREVCKQAGPQMLEPMVDMHVTVPIDCVGDVYSDMATRRGQISGTQEAGANMQTVVCVVPLAETTSYARSLSSLTGGQGSYSMSFSHYAPLPSHLQDKHRQHIEEEDES
ncbi:elongation factor G [Blastopirellula marina]|uniref:Elongation factor G n=1 Tax=Blastopirellula marina TaxID=124 RepID=A0A2S8FB54_9BACT|nr:MULTISPECIES: elongation factor G [Pirellulaceae]PQO29164.1 elongation factor G [Blastopirellula marina]RCS50357.1 elongation factor G [Bremerella cremea]